MADIDYTDELTAISTWFNGFFSEQCGGIQQFLWAIGNSEEEKSSVLPYTDIGIVVAGNGSGYAQVY